MYKGDREVVKSSLDEITWCWQWMNPTAAPAQLLLCAWLRFKPPLCPHQLLLKPSGSAFPNCKQRIDSLRYTSKSRLLIGRFYLKEAEGSRCTAVKLMSHFMESLCAGLSLKLSRRFCSRTRGTQWRMKWLCRESTYKPGVGNLTRQWLIYCLFGEASVHIFSRIQYKVHIKCGYE